MAKIFLVVFLIFQGCSFKYKVKESIPYKIVIKNRDFALVIPVL